MYKLLSHHHSRLQSPVHRLPAALKLGAALVIIASTVLVPGHWTLWFAGVFVLLLGVMLLSRIPPLFLLKRFLMLSPFVAGAAVVNALQPAPTTPWPVLAMRSLLCLLAILLLSNTTPLSELLRVLRRAGAPGLLVTTLALMHRYLFVLAEESERMRRARASRTFTRDRRVQWQALTTLVAVLFVRASERAERIYAAMCARGWK
jgi:cobalt/nickel transport system permease protein